MVSAKVSPESWSSAVLSESLNTDQARQLSHFWCEHNSNFEWLSWLPSWLSPSQHHDRATEAELKAFHTECRLRRGRWKEHCQCKIYFLRRFQGRRWDKYMLWEYNRGEAVWVMLSEVNNTGASDLKVVKWIFPTILFTVIKIVSVMFLLIYPIWLNNLLFVITGEKVILRKPAWALKNYAASTLFL